MQPLLLKQKVPDCGQTQHENHLHSKTGLLDYHDSSANVANSEFYSNHVTTSRPIAISHFQTKIPCHFVTQSIKITAHIVHFRSEKQKSSVYFPARGLALLWSFFHLNCSTSIGYNEPGRVGIPAVRVVIVWVLSIVVSARLLETTLFMGKLLM